MLRSLLLLIGLNVCIAVEAGESAGFLIDRSGHHSKLVHPDAEGRLRYVPDARGDTILDFSNAGYAGGGVAIPDVPVAAMLSSRSKGDDTARIQAAIDKLARHKIDRSGFRGTLLLKRGRYRIEGNLRIHASGIVLRGEGQGEDGTILIATGKETRTLIVVAGEGRAEVDTEGQQKIVDERVPVGSRWVTVADAAAFSVGQNVFVERNGNEAWIHEIGMDRILKRPDGTKPTKQWQPFTLTFDRVITAIDGSRIELDAPISCAIEQKWGGGQIAGYRFPGRIRNCGVEHLRIITEFDKTVTDEQKGLGTYYSDEDHSSRAVSLNNLISAWVRNVTMLHFRGGISIESSSKWTTVQDCVSMDMVAQIFGGRRSVFGNNGQLGLVQRCYAETARHAFIIGSRVCGPNAFVDCVSRKEFNSSEPHHRWSVGGLYDNVHGFIRFQDRQWMGSGQGWAGANYLAWNTQGTLAVQSPPTARNLAIGHVGERDPGYFVLQGQEWKRENPGKPLPLYYSQGQGYWDSHGTHVAPRSLYLAQLEDRLGPGAVRAVATPAQLNGTIQSAILEHARNQGAEYDSEVRSDIRSDNLF